MTTATATKATVSNTATVVDFSKKKFVPQTFAQVVEIFKQSRCWAKVDVSKCIEGRQTSSFFLSEASVEAMNANKIHFEGILTGDHNQKAPMRWVQVLNALAYKNVKMFDAPTLIFWLILSQSDATGLTEDAIKSLSVPTGSDSDQRWADANTKGLPKAAINAALGQVARNTVSTKFSNMLGDTKGAMVLAGLVKVTKDKGVNHYALTNCKANKAINELLMSAGSDRVVSLLTKE